MPETKPFLLTVQGSAEIPLPAERAVINVNVASSGNNKAAVSDEVITTAKHVESMLRELAPKDESKEAKEASPLAHWSKTSLSSTSHEPYNHKEDKYMPRQYSSSLTFDIRFKDFRALGSFGTRLSSLSHVEMQNIDWILTPATEKSYRSTLRKQAAQDAMTKARDYCEVLGCTNVRPIELNEDGDIRVMTGRSRGGARMLQYQQQPMAMAAQELHVQSAPGSGEGETRTEDLEFTPQEVKMDMEVTVKFHAGPVVNSN